jgi:dTMP kinase
MIRQIVLDPATGEMSPRAEALLYAADKAQHIFSVVQPALERGAVVICDRYVDSMLAYQGAAAYWNAAEIEQIARWATEDLRPV